MPDQIYPYSLAIAIADHVARDSGNGKCTIVGTFDRITVPALPAVHPALGIYWALIGGKVRFELTLRFFHADTPEDPLLELIGEAEFNDPKLPVEEIAQVAPLILEHAGEYRIELTAGGKLMFSRPLFVAVASAPPSED